ncbi:hypothetical protein [Nitratireductor sp.]|uniref:hypothetical protein n=1 Tax=Nitratireductor TaxID=245876 RepID=UPI002612EAE1|nr:hypothetical protein [Nitratireductor sp.]MCV0351407.1 hypothetical protein [Nitratireductor sp.]
MIEKFLFGLALCAGISGCTTAREATQQTAVRWVGSSSDQFFAIHGAPYSSFERDDGGKIYRWRGGETSIRRSLDSSVGTQPGNGFGKSYSRSSKKVSRPDANTTRTRTRSSSASFNINVAGILNAQKPAYRDERLYCELSISTDTNGVITSLQRLADTGGAFSLSRCDEVLSR